MDISGIPLGRRTVRDVMEQALAVRDGQPALIDASRTLTYADAWNEALVIAGGLAEAGVGARQTVLMMLDNHVDNAVTWLALGLSGRVECSINTAFRGSMLAYLITDSGADTIVIERRYLALLIEIQDDVPGLRTVVVRHDDSLDYGEAGQAASRLWRVRDFAELRAARAAAPEAIAPWDLMSITYTSGTTGRSKGVLCPHGHGFGQATSDGLGASRPDEVRFIVLPQFHAAGRWGGVYHSLIHGATACIAASFSASGYWEQARAANARTSQLVGTMADFLRRQPTRPGDREHGLREICILPLPRDLDSWRDRFSVAVTTSYGSTEVGAIVHTARPSSRSVGRVREGYDVRIFDENDVEVPHGQVGEAVLRPVLPWTTSIGYLGRPEETAAAWRNGWLHSGDALYRDEDGNFFFVDRLDDSIRRRGENISSAEVETFVLAHPAVAECAAVAVPSEYEEDEIKVAVTLKPGETLTGGELVEFLARAMPAFMVPRFVQILDELPKTITAKVRKRELRDGGTAGCWDRAKEGMPDRARVAGAEPALGRSA